jgi:hypothetical protein
MSHISTFWMRACGWVVFGDAFAEAMLPPSCGFYLLPGAGFKVKPAPGLESKF